MHRLAPGNIQQRHTIAQQQRGEHSDTGWWASHSLKKLTSSSNSFQEV
ncbi:hypothetical protein C4K09_4058 [Pseudomonas chlororaphis subsp. aureofaciens]|nr:hypothetical protein C4K09_4058 [Pseudomonas chlororaphis subsp. aureofaciens]